MKVSFRKSQRFCRCERLKKSKDIKIIFRDGKKVSTVGARLFFKPKPGGGNRIAFTFPRGYGNAVQRNYSKRLGREAFRLMKNELKTSYDLLLLVYPGKDSFHFRRQQLQSLCVKAGLLAV